MPRRSGSSQKPRLAWPLAGGLAVALMITSSSAAAASAGHSVVKAHPRANGEQVGRNRSVRPGQRVQAVVAGFAANAVVEVSVACFATPIDVRADAAGVVMVSYTVPASLPAGPHSLVVSGSPPVTAARPAPPGAEAITVTIPRLSYIRFTVRDIHGELASAPTC